LDARPSDAIALAVRMGIPVYAAKDVLDRAASTFSLDAADDEDEGDEAIEAAPPIERAPLPAPEREQTGEPIDASRLLIFRDFVNSIDDPERRGHS
jgi:bifunctional DNase/RNase